MERRVDFTTRANAVSGTRGTLSKLSNERFMGRAQVLLSAVCFGTIGVSSKIAYASGIDSALLLSLRFSVAAIALWVYSSSELSVPTNVGIELKLSNFIRICFQSAACLRIHNLCTFSAEWLSS